ncbi:hypothetical protein ABPG74_022581 [Tetrahymena malaccensis]
MIETEIKSKSPLKTRDFLWFVILYQLMVHLVSHWDNYYCGSNFNVFLICIYIIHLLRRIISYLGKSLRSKALTWIGYSFVIPILVWSSVTAYYLQKYQDELTDYSNCSSFFITLTFVVYGFVVSIYQIIKIVTRRKQHTYSEVDEEFLGRVSTTS